MKFSLINVSVEHDGMVDGNWIQDHTGTLETAQEAARKTERANGNMIRVAVVDQIPSTSNLLGFYRGLKVIKKDR